MAYLARVLVSGTAASLASAAAALACSRLENGHAARSMNAVAHIYDGGAPPARNGRGGRNTVLGFAIHTAASWWWGLFFEASPRRAADAAAVSALAYLVDYHVVGKRFRPGFEAHLKPASLLAVYAALAAGFTLGGKLNRRLDHHEKEDRHEGDERRPAKRRPYRVVAPEERR